MQHPLLQYCSLAVLVLLFTLSTQSLADAANANIHQDYNSPFHNNSNNYSVVSNDHHDEDVTIEIDITAAKYTYLMTLNVKTTDDGTPPVPTYAIPDTGSDLIWLNAKGCSGEACHCGVKGAGACIEKPRDKQLIKCSDTECGEMTSLNIKTKCPANSEHACEYDIDYKDGSKAEGVLGKGTFQFPGVDHKEIAFGVSSKSEGRLEKKSEGIVGLGRGKLSLFHQYRNKGDFSFSYCLPQYHPKSESKSKLRFGPRVTITSDKKSMSLVNGETVEACKNRYCLRLVDISLEGVHGKIIVGDTKVMVIDSGTTFTYLSDGLFTKFLEKVKHAIDRNIKPEPRGVYDNCFREENVAKKLEKVSFKFYPHTTIELKRDNFLDHYTPDGGKTNYLCLTVVDGDKKENHEKLLRAYGMIENTGSRQNQKLHLLGSRAQMDFNVTIDVRNNKVSFDDTKGCSEHKVESSVL